MRLFDSELKIMELLWAQGDMTAKELAETFIDCGVE